MGDRYIRPFDMNHWVYLAILATIAMLMYLFRYYIRRNHRRMSLIIVTISILQQILLYGYYIFVEGFTLAESMPLHISRVNTILGIIYLLTRKRSLVPYISYFSVFALLSFLVPVEIDVISHPLGLSYLVNHVITLLLPFFAMLGGDYVEKGDMKKAYIGFLAYAVPIYFLNPLIGGNYFYLVRKPILKNLQDICYIPLMLAVVLFLFYLESLLFLWFAGRVRKDDSLSEIPE